jgi:hypothetical protein
MNPNTQAHPFRPRTTIITRMVSRLMFATRMAKMSNAPTQTFDVNKASISLIISPLSAGDYIQDCPSLQVFPINGSGQISRTDTEKSKR